MSAQIMERAFLLLSERVPGRTRLLLGGGGCMILAHKFPLATTDVDAVPVGRDFSELEPIVKAIALELNLPSDWLNPYFSSFLHVLPSDYKQRLITVFASGDLTVDALGAEDMLILKCFAHRPKDYGHARSLIKAGADLLLVEKQIESLLGRKIPGSQDALEFFDALCEDLE